MLGYKRQTVYGIVGALFLTMLVSIVDARPQPHTNHCPDAAAYLELLEEPAEKLLPVIIVSTDAWHPPLPSTIALTPVDGPSLNTAHTAWHTGRSPPIRICPLS